MDVVTGSTLIDTRRYQCPRCGQPKTPNYRGLCPACRQNEIEKAESYGGTEAEVSRRVREAIDAAEIYWGVSR